MKLNKNEAVARIQKYFEENENVFNACIEELDSYNGYLGDNRYYEMDELDELYHDEEPSEILRRAFYGYDERCYYIDKYGDKHPEEFNPNRDYFKFNAYGNLVSSDYKNYTDLLDDYVIEQMTENRNEISTIDETDELAELFDALDEDEEDEEGDTNNAQ